MTESSPRMQWSYPSENEDPWWEKFVDLIRGMDASGYAAREDRNLLIMGGGTVAWNSGTGVLSWSSAIEFLSPNTGFLNQIPAGSVTIADGQVVRGNVARALGANASMAVSSAGFALSNDNSVVLCIRRGTQLFWRNGLLMSNGDTVSGIGSTQGGGAVTLAGDVTGPSGTNVVERIRGTNVVGTAPTANQLLAFVSPNWTPVTIGGDISGPITAVSVVALRGDPIDPSIAPALNDVLLWDGTQWVSSPAPGGSTAVFVYEEGGVETGNVYNTWGTLYAAISAVAGPKIVRVSDALGSPVISAGGPYNLDDVELVGAYNTLTGSRPTIQIQNGATITGNFRTTRLVLQLAAGAASPITFFGSGFSRYELEDADWDGGVASNGILAILASGGINFVLRGQSRLFSTAVLNNGGACNFELRDRSRLDSDAVSGAFGSISVQFTDPDTTIFQTQSGFSGSVFLFTPTYRDIVLDKQQVGTTALHVGSVKLASNQRLLAASAAMLGGSIPSETATLELRRFTGGAVIATWSVTAALGDVQLVADVTIPADDWYDFYLYAGGVAETALVKGVMLLTVQE